MSAIASWAAIELAGAGCGDASRGGRTLCVANESALPDRDAAGADDPLERRAIAEARRGDPRAYEYLVEKHMRRVYSIVRAVVRNDHDAEDLTQDAFVRAWETIDRFREGEPFGPWICRIAVNRSLDLVKHRRRVPHDELSETEMASRRDDADLGALTGEITHRIEIALESLPEMQGLVARLYLVEELGHGEIATLLGLSEGTIRSHLSLARRRLQEMLYDLHGGRS